jgi:preprotein translocase subunit SecA
VIRLLENLFRPVSAEKQLQTINSRRQALADADDTAVKAAAKQSRSLTETIAVTAVAAERVLGIRMFDVQLQGALTLAKGRIAEMQTGEGKTLAAVPAIVWYASHGNGIHVMTANDYLARRDAEWMGGIFRYLGLTVGCIQQDMSSDQRRSAYASDITYGTANEVGFDYLRDQLALFHKDQVHRNFYAALIDEADSILIDEARVPLVIAGDEKPTLSLAYRVDEVTRHFRRHAHFTVDESSRNIGLTDAGIRAIETAFDCGNLFELENAELHAAVQDSIHAHALLRRDVDYLVKNGAIESVDEFKGRIIQDRRWPGGLHTAIEAKEGVSPKKQGRVLGSITLQDLIALYPMVCGMTGTAATQASEFRKIYDLEVEVIPTNRPMIRIDHPDRVFRTMPEKEEALVEEIRSTHKTGQPLLVGTHSVEESERLSSQLIEIPHQVLNARNDEVEAAIVRRAGERGAVTISTNMAGRGTDIQLGTGVAELGGLYVIGTNRHESVRIDNQLRGRAGRQGDPGCSRFFVSYQDELLLKYGIDDETYSTPAEIQRRIEGQMLDIRQFLNKYERVAEGQRMAIHMRRQDLLDGTTPCKSELERLASLITIDDMWAEYLSALAEIRSGVHWVSLSGGARDPIQSFFKFGGFDAFREYLRKIHALFKELLVAIDEETPLRLANMELNGIDPTQRGSTWTYITTDQPFTTWVAKALRELLKRKPA